LNGECCPIWTLVIDHMADAPVSQPQELEKLIALKAPPWCDSPFGPLSCDLSTSLAWGIASGDHQSVEIGSGSDIQLGDLRHAPMAASTVHGTFRVQASASRAGGISGACQPVTGQRAFPRADAHSAESCCR